MLLPLQIVASCDRRAIEVMACWRTACRCFRLSGSLQPCFPGHISSSVKFDATSEDVSDLLDRHLAPGMSKIKQGGRVLSTRGDALALYRTICRYTILFDWQDDQGIVWRDKLRTSARHEFEAARNVNDPEVIAKMLINGRQAVEQIMSKFIQKHESLQKQEAAYFNVPIRR